MPPVDVRYDAKAAPMTKRGSPRTKYAPPSTIVRVPSDSVGITNGMLLRFPTLFAAGDLQLLKCPSVAIVGSRTASPAGRQRAAQLARDLARANIVVMSGLAAGIDAAAHEAAIMHGGRTIAVIGTPLDKAYPKENIELQQQIYDQHLLISPFEAGNRTFPSHFPERNRIMARLSRATVIVEASDTSGSLHQAVESVNVGRPLFIAESVVNNARLTWPARFIGLPGVSVLKSSRDVISAIASDE